MRRSNSLASGLQKNSSIVAGNPFRNASGPMLIQGSMASKGPPMHYVGDPNSYKIPDCLKELVDYKNSQDYMMFKQLHRQLISKTTKPQPIQQ